MKFVSHSLVAVMVFVPPARAAMASGQSLAKLKAHATEIVHSLEAAELWMGGAVVVTNGTDLSVSTYGVRSPSDSHAPTGNSHFEIASVTKSFTGILLAWVVNDKPQVHLDDPIEKFVPELQGHFSGKLTLRGLATQVSGLPASFCVGAARARKCYFTPADPNNPWVDLTEAELLEFLKDYARPDSPPYAYVYSNPGFITLGYVLSRITRQSYPQLLHQVITGPLKMNDTVINQPGRAVSDFLQGFNVILQPQAHWQFALAAPTGGLVSTANDMAKFLLANLKPPNSPLGKAITSSQENGLGWDSPPGSAILWKSGGTYGFSSYLMVDPTHHQAWVALSNVASNYSGSNFPPYALFGGVRPDIFGLPLSDTALNAFVGNYLGPKALVQAVTISKPGHFLRLNGGGANLDFRLQPISATEFAVQDVAHYIGYHKVSFRLDPQGGVQGFVLHYNNGSGNFTDFDFRKAD